MSRKLQFKLLSSNAKSPTKEHTTDSGHDLYIANETVVPANSTVILNTDVSVNLPYKFEGQIRPRSGVTSKTKLRVQLGTIDNDYHGNLGIIVDNISDEDIQLKKHFKLAQLVVVPILMIDSEVVDEFYTTTERGEKGFGSSDE